MKTNLIKTVLAFVFGLATYNANAQERTTFPNGPSYYYEKDGVEIKSFASCGTWVYGPKACYRIRNKNSYTIIFRIKYLLKNGDWIKGEERKIGSGEIQDYEEWGGCSYCDGVADLKIDYVQ